MSLRNLSTMLVVMMLFAALGGSGVRAGGVRSPASDLPPHHAVQPGAAIADLLPVQSKDMKTLGLGRLLVASRELGDPNFAQTVVLLVHYDEERVVGLIVNRRSDVPLSKVLEDLQTAKDRSDPVYLGGPVDRPSVFALLHSPAKLEAAEHVFGGVYLINTAPLFQQIIAANPEPGKFHVYLGYAGWTTDQLRMEVALGSWFIFPADAKTVFDPDPDTLWSRMIHKTELELARDGGSAGKKHLPQGARRPPHQEECGGTALWRAARLPAHRPGMDSQAPVDAAVYPATWQVN